MEERILLYPFKDSKIWRAEHTEISGMVNSMDKAQNPRIRVACSNSTETGLSGTEHPLAGNST